MRKNLIVLLIIAGMSLFSMNKDSLSLGFRIEDINNNLGFNLDVVSPTILNHLNVRVSGGYVLEKPEYELESNKFLVGLRGYGAPVTDFLKLYGEFGGVFLLKDEKFYSGLYGLFGFEFFTARNYYSPVSYFIELGTNGMFKNSYSGFTTNVGFRYYF